MKKTTSNILFIALMALLLFSLSGCAQEKEENTEENDPQALLMSVDALFAEFPPLIVELGQAEKLRNGAQVKDWHFAPGMYRVYSITGEFLLLGKVENTVLTTIKSFFEVTKA